MANQVKEARFLNLKMKTPGASSPSKTESPSYPETIERMNFPQTKKPYGLQMSRGL